METERDHDHLTEEISLLRREIVRLNSHRFIRIQNSVPRLLMFQFARGLALGLGTVLGGGLFLSVIIWILSHIDFIPIFGEWAVQIADRLAANGLERVETGE